METKENCDVKCNSCKTYRYPSHFINTKGRKLKSCLKCRNTQKKIRENNKCEHNRQRSSCKDCGGSSICEHNRERSYCKECKGSSICEHNRIRNECKECKGSSICEHNRIRKDCKDCSDPLKLTIKNWIKCSKQKDKKYNRLDPTNLIDTEFCQNLIKEYPNCNYCKIQLQYTTYQDNLSTIERINNDLGHIKNNCILACRKCNFSRVGSK